jgi:AcrR family transcriptional regulator
VVPRRSAADAAATRDALLAAARAAFSTAGYAAVTLDGIAKEAGVTRGAVHHHFSDKRTIFVEVFRQLEQELNESIVATALAAPEEQRIRAGCEALFDWFAQPQHRQITVADAPSVLGLAAWYDIDRGIGMPTMRAGIQALADAGLLHPHLVEPVTILLYGALTEAALVLGTGVTDVTRQQMLDAIERLVAGLAAPTPTSRKNRPAGRP